MRMQVEQSVEVTLKMSGEEFKSMMNGLNIYAHAAEDSNECRIKASDVYSRLVEIAKISGFVWSE